MKSLLQLSAAVLLCLAGAACASHSGPSSSGRDSSSDRPFNPETNRFESGTTQHTPNSAGTNEGSGTYRSR